MKKIKYFYNTHTLRYEKLETPFKVRLLKFFGFVAAALVTSYFIIQIGQKYYPNEKQYALQKENDNLHYSIKLLQGEVNNMGQRMTALEKRDNEVYRAIFESNPIPDSAREKTVEKIEELKKVSEMSQDFLLKNINTNLQKLSNRMIFQQKSLGEIDKMIEKKEDLLAAIPAIQPISNKQLERIASGFGYRIDPVYKIPKMHAGLDFTALTGTPIYATANGKVEEAGYSEGGYGNLVIINHGYGYQTLYGHMVKIKARKGQLVKRGEIIGWVGSTGKSTGPHCHYEVRKNGSPVDPVYYFYNDLSPEQYERLLKIAAAKNQSFD